MDKELLKRAFEAGRTWQIAEDNEFSGGYENEKPNFEKWYEELNTNTIYPRLCLDKILRLDEPYNLHEILKGLIEAADILLHRKDYDGDGWEKLEYCYRNGKDVIKEFDV